jgi:1-acyl-sn-glycerol-3-phosphate acyltransferase
VSRLPPRSAAWLTLARAYARRRLARDLDGVRVRGLEGTGELGRTAPLILAANHVNWWDSFLVVTVDEALGGEGRALMDEENLRSLPFFARLGALPLRPTRARTDLGEAATRLTEPGHSLWIFPQGAHRPPHLRPLGFGRGVELLAAQAPAAEIVPVALQYAWGEQPGPGAWIDLGAPLRAADVAVRGGARCVEAAVVRGLERIDAALLQTGDHDFCELVPSRRRGAGVGARLLSARRG